MPAIWLGIVQIDRRVLVGGMMVAWADAQPAELAMAEEMPLTESMR
jgi:hypothetical protein